MRIEDDDAGRDATDLFRISTIRLHDGITNTAIIS